MITALMTIIILGCSMGKQPAKTSGEEPASAANDNNLPDGMEVPPVMAFCVKGLPLFAPFNEGDLLDEGKILRQSPEKYTKVIFGDTSFDISYKEEKNKDLEHDNSYLNQYYYQSKDEMKGQIFNYADANAVAQYLNDHGFRTDEGELIEMEYTDGIMVSDDYLKDRTIMKAYSTTTEDPDGPQFDASTVAAVEKAVGAKVLKNRISYVIGDEYNFGIMTTQPNENYGIAAWVLDKAGDVTLWTDTCEVIDGEVNWSNYDPEEYNEPGIIAVVKGKEGLDIFCNHMETDETVNFILMRQKGKKFQQFHLGGFYQLYE